MTKTVEQGEQSQKDNTRDAAGKNDRATVDRLVGEALAEGIPLKVAKKLQHLALGQSEGLESLEAEAMHGILAAAKSFDGSSPWPAWATKKAAGYVLDADRKHLTATGRFSRLEDVAVSMDTGELEGAKASGHDPAPGLDAAYDGEAVADREERRLQRLLDRIGGPRNRKDLARMLSKGMSSAEAARELGLHSSGGPRLVAAIKVDLEDFDPKRGCEPVKA